MKRKPIVAWAVVCKRKRRVESAASTYSNAKSAKKYFDGYDCGPHRIVKLVEEREKVSNTKQEVK